MAATSAAREPAVGAAEERHPPLAVDADPGATTTTVTAVSSPRARTRTPTPTSLPPTLAAAAGRAPRGRGRAGPASAPCRLAGASASGWRAAAGASGERLGEAQPRHVAEQRRRGAARADLDDGAGPAALGEGRADRVAPGRLALGPDVVAERVRETRSVIGLHESPAAPSPPGRDPDVDAPRPGRRSRRSGRRPEQLLAEQVRDLRLADAREAQRPARDVARRRRARARRGRTWSAHIGRISRGGPGSATTTRPSGRSTHQPGAVPFGFGSAVGRRDQPGLLQVHLRECHPAPRPQRRGATPPGPASIDRRLAERPRRSPRGSGRPASGRDRRSRRRGRPAPARRRTRRGPRRGRRGVPGSGRPRRRSTVRLRASSPAFVSRVSPTVSSEPMLSSSAVRSGRGRPCREPSARGPCEPVDGRADPRWRYHRTECHATFAPCRGERDRRSSARHDALGSDPPEAAMSDIEQSGFSEFDRWRALARRTRELLDAAIGERVAAGRRRRLPGRPDPAPRRGHPDRLPRLAAVAMRPASPSCATCSASSAAIRVEPAAIRRRATRGRGRERARATLLIAARDGAGPRVTRSAAPSRGTSPPSPTPASCWRCCRAIPDADVRFPAGRRTYADIAAAARSGRARRPARGAGAAALADGGRPRAGSGRSRRSAGRTASSTPPTGSAAGRSAARPDPRPTTTRGRKRAVAPGGRLRAWPLVSSAGSDQTRRRGAHPLDESQSPAPRNPDSADPTPPEEALQARSRSTIHAARRRAAPGATPRPGDRRTAAAVDAAAGASAPPPASPPRPPAAARSRTPPPPPPPPPGFREQIGATRDAAKRLVDAHVELGKAEFEEIGGEIKRVAALAGIAVGAAIFAGLLLAIGLPLFLGEWIFGSIGWGLLLGVLFLVGDRRSPPR